MSKFMNYNEDSIRENFRQSKDSIPNSNPKIEPDKRTTETLCDGSTKLLKEDKKFLKDIYGSI